MLEKIDKTIEVLCDTIQRETKTSGYVHDMVKALAELVSARAKLNKKL